MLVTPIKTVVVKPNDDLFVLLDGSIRELAEGSVVAVTSKILSLCEGRVMPFNNSSKEELIAREADYYLSPELSKYNHHFTITKNILIAGAGIDGSNGGDNYVLWPADSQSSANFIRKYLTKRFKLSKIGVIITDSTSQPLRRGTTGIALAHSGFKALKNYIGEPDLFGRPFTVSQANVAGGLAAAAVVAMGEGTEQTPLAVLSDLPFVEFNSQDPDPEELAEINLNLRDDLFAPFLENAPWQRGHQK